MHGIKSLKRIKNMYVYTFDEWLLKKNQSVHIYQVKMLNPKLL